MTASSLASDERQRKNKERHERDREAVSRARYCAWLLEEGGLPVRTITTSHQREVIWRDAHQIVEPSSVKMENFR